MTLTIGSLCTGYGGLDMAVEQVLDARTAWVSDIDKGACKVLGHRYPGVPNIGDMTAADWAAVEPVDVITGGTPCQDLSHAGKRAGMTEGTRSNLWVSMREAIATIRPRLVVWENVGGALSAEADSELVRDARLLAGVRRRPGHPLLRAAARVVGDLSSLGYLGGVHALRAADVGAPHGRLRVFIVATAADTDGSGWGEHGRTLPVRPEHVAAQRSGAAPDVTLLPTPNTGESATGHGRRGGKVGNGRQSGASLDQIHHLLPTPAVNDMGAAYTPAEWDAWTERMKAEHGNGNGHGKSLNIEAQRLLPTPRASDGPDATSHARSWSGTDHNMHNVVREQQWGQYAAAIVRWENLTRPAPAPTETGPKGNPRLSPAFTEWMMGLPAGWITDTPNITRNEALKLCGNGVVPQQAAAAIRFLLDVIGEQVAA